MDILITSSSRPDLLQQTIKSMQDKLKFSGTLRWLLHEDCLDENRSTQVICWAEQSNLFDEIVVSKPRIGLGASVYEMFSYIESLVFFRSCDDWRYTKEIDLDILLNLFEKYEKINQIVFHKRCVEGTKNEFLRESTNFDGTWLTITNQWGWIPAIWRTGFVKEKYKLAWTSGISFFDELKGKTVLDPMWFKENMGAYLFGKIEESDIFIKHIGGGRRTLDNGGCFGIY